VQSIRGRFCQIVSEFSPDIVLGCWAYPDGWAAVQLANERNLPVAIKVHGSDLLIIDDQPARKRRTIQALTRADAVIAVSRDLADRAVAMGATRTHVVYNVLIPACSTPARAMMRAGNSTSPRMIR